MYSFQIAARSIISFNLFFLLLAKANAADIQVGPGSVTTTTAVAAGNTVTVVNNTQVSVGGNGFNVAGGILQFLGTSSIQTSGTGFGINVGGAGNASYVDIPATANLSINTTGATYSYGIWSTGAGTRTPMVSANNLTINTVGNGSAGVILDSGSKGALNNLIINTTGAKDPANNNAGAYGISNQNSSSATYSRVSILSSASTGVLNTNTSFFSGEEFIIRSQGDGSYGINTQTGSQTFLNNSQIITEGATGLGIRLSCANYSTTEIPTRFTGNNLEVTTYGTAASAVVTRSNSQATISNIRTTTFGNDAAGLYAVDEASLLNVNNAVVRTSGNTSFGLAARTGGFLNLNGGNIITSGSNSSGVFVEESLLLPSLETRLDLANSFVQTQGFSAPSLEILNGGILNVESSNAEALGSSSPGLLIFSIDPRSSVANINNSFIKSYQDTGVSLMSGNSVLNVSNSTVTGNGYWLIVGDPSNTSITPIDLPLGSEDNVGNDAGTPFAPYLESLEGVQKESLLFFAPAPSVSQITVTNSELNGAALTVAGSTSNVVLTNSLWNMTGSSNLTSLLNDSSTVHFFSPTIGGYKTLTVENYVGNNGTLILNIYLNADNSPTDQLVIAPDGTATGSTKISINNTGGLGARTIANGIMVVDASEASTDPSAFSLAAPVEAGPYEYFLYRGAVDGTDLESWYLRSQYNPYRREVSLYSALYSNMLIYNRSVLGTFHRRVGEEEQVHSARANQNEPYMNGGWLRFINHGGTLKNKGVLQDGPRFNYQNYAVQAGIDVYHLERPEGNRDYAGFYFTGGGNSGSVKHYTGSRAGDLNFLSYGFGLYYTHIFKNDAYVDALVQGNYFEPDVHSKNQILAPMQTKAYALSVEAGYPLYVKNHWSIAPEGQLIYQNLPGARSSDAAAYVRFASNDSFITRLGPRIIWNKNEGVISSQAIKNQTSLWLTPSFSYEALGKSKTSFSSDTGWIPFYSNLKGAWFTLDLGGTIQVNDILSLYGTVAGETYLNGRGQSYDVIAGLRFNL